MSEEIVPKRNRRILKIKSSKDVRFYLYVSDTKLDMLFEQLFTTSKRSIQRELTVKVGIVSGSMGSATEEPIPDRDDRLRAVEEELIERNLVGTPQHPKEYFKGTLPMRWGLYNDLETRPAGCPPLVYFGGIDPNIPLIVGLGGSSVHVVGHDGATSTYSRSATPTLVKWLLHGLYDEAQIGELHRRRELGLDGDLYEAICTALHYLMPPTQQLEFLAKTLAEGTSYGLEHMTGFPETRVLLGTPLYVQQSRPLQPEKKVFGLDDEWKRYLSILK